MYNELVHLKHKHIFVTELLCVAMNSEYCFYDYYNDVRLISQRTQSR